MTRGLSFGYGPGVACAGVVMLLAAVALLALLPAPTSVHVAPTSPGPTVTCTIASSAVGATGQPCGRPGSSGGQP